ncbi:hypothetical protein BTW01_11265 [Bacillus sp. SKDU12]|nr:hypothetical protein BTW01_11265 [Bacillus sp. SKDU12]
MFPGTYYVMTMKQSDDQIRFRMFKAWLDESRLVIIRTLYYSGKELSCGVTGEKCNIVKSQHQII